VPEHERGGQTPSQRPMSSREHARPWPTTTIRGRGRRRSARGRARDPRRASPRLDHDVLVHDRGGHRARSDVDGRPAAPTPRPPLRAERLLVLPDGGSPRHDHRRSHPCESIRQPRFRRCSSRQRSRRREVEASVLLDGVDVGRGPRSSPGDRDQNVVIERARSSAWMLERDRERFAFPGGNRRRRKGERVTADIGRWMVSDTAFVLRHDTSSRLCLTRLAMERASKAVSDTAAGGRGLELSAGCQTRTQPWRVMTGCSRPPHPRVPAGRLPAASGVHVSTLAGARRISSG